MKDHEEIDLYILPDGTLKYVYDDDLVFLTKIGKTELKRASHVDPILEDGKVNWYIDLSPSGGPKKKGPYKTRNAAIQAEIKWLNKNAMKL